MTKDREILVQILDDSDPEGGTFPGQDEDLETFWGAQADAILDSDWLRKVKADAWEEAVISVQYDEILGGLDYPLNPYRD